MNPIDNPQYKYNITLDPPNTGSQGTKEGEVDGTKKGQITFTDKLTGATMVLSATFDKLGKMTIYMDSENPTLPTPPITSLEISSALKPGDKSARGNPFLAPIPFVQVAEALLELYSIMRVSNLGMAAYENSCMELSMSLARTEADLIISAADKEAKMAIMEAVGAGMALAGACVQLGGAIKGLTSGAKARMGEASKDLKAAKAKGDQNGHIENLKTAKADLTKKQENLNKFEAADQNLTDATSAREATLKNKNQVQKDLHELQETSKVSGTKEQQVAIKEKQAEFDKLDMADLEASNKVKSAQKDLDKLKGDLGLDTPEVGVTDVGPKQRLKDQVEAQNAKVTEAQTKAQTDLDDIAAKESKLNQAQQYHSAKSSVESALTTAIAQIITQGGVIIKSGVNSVLIGEKAQDEARQKMVAADRENLNRIMDGLDKSIQKGGDIMNSLIQAIEKLANEHVNAVHIG